MVSIEGIGAKVEQHAELVGILAGTFKGGIPGDIIPEIMELPTSGHIPDIMSTIQHYFQLGEVTSGIIIWLIGYIGKDFGFPYAHGLQRFGKGYLEGLAAQQILWNATH